MSNIQEFVIDSVIEYVVDYKTKRDEEVIRLQQQIKHLKNRIKLVKASGDYKECVGCKVWLVDTTVNYTRCYECEVPDVSYICEPCGIIKNCEGEWVGWNDPDWYCGGCCEKLT